MSGESTIAGGTNGGESGAEMRDVGVNLAARRRESALLMALGDSRRGARISTRTCDQIYRSLGN